VLSPTPAIVVPQHGAYSLFERKGRVTPSSLSQKRRKNTEKGRYRYRSEQVMPIASMRRLHRGRRERLTCGNSMSVRPYSDSIPHTDPRGYFSFRKSHTFLFAPSVGPTRAVQFASSGSKSFVCVHMMTGETRASRSRNGTESRTCGDCACWKRMEKVCGARAYTGHTVTHTPLLARSLSLSLICGSPMGHSFVQPERSTIQNPHARKRRRIYAPVPPGLLV
jgi:hypothetical protein